MKRKIIGLGIFSAFAAGIQYQPDHGDTSATSILLTANDNGHTGEGSAQETTRLLNVVFGQFLED